MYGIWIQADTQPAFIIFVIRDIAESRFKLILIKPFHYHSFEMSIKETYWIEWHGSSQSSH